MGELSVFVKTIWIVLYRMLMIMYLLKFSVPVSFLPGPVVGLEGLVSACAEGHGLAVGGDFLLTGGLAVGEEEVLLSNSVVFHKGIDMRLCPRRPFAGLGLCP